MFIFVSLCSATFIVNGGQLRVRTANASTSGVFQCLARNIHGSILSQIFVQINGGG